MKRYETVDAYIDGAEHWQDELRRLREILLSTPLEETVKWGAPCYTHGGTNVVALTAFKSYVGLWFYQGALLSDPHEVLVNAQEGKTKALRQWRFESAKDIKARAIKSYVKEAIELQSQGIEIKPVRQGSVSLPLELQAALDKYTKHAARFAELTPGRQREYASYIAEAKRDETKQKRIEKILPLILEGVGLNDQYR